MTSIFRFALAAALICGWRQLAWAQGNTGSSTSTNISRGNGLRIPQYRTVGSATTTSYFVDPTGNDANACTASGTSACLTIQGALNKIPKLLRNQVTVTVAAGSYAGFIVSSFTGDNDTQQTTGGLLIQGTLTNSTLATGTATGTATGGSAGTGATFGTLVNAGAGWTTNDLAGRIITTATPTNTEFVIVSNTATTLTIAGTWSAPTGSTTYTIQDAAADITTGVTLPANPIQAAAANRVAFSVMNNNMTWRDSAIVIRYFRTSNSSGSIAEINDNSTVTLVSNQFRSSSATSFGLSIANLASGVNPTVLVQKCDVNATASSNPVLVLSGGSLGISNSLIRGVSTTNPAINFNASVTQPNGRFRQFATSQIQGYASGINAAFTGGALMSFTGVNITCGQLSGYGINLGNAPAVTTRTSPGAISSITSTNVTSCATAVRASGDGVVDITSLGGEVSTALSAVQGPMFVYTNSGTTIDAGTDISLDDGTVTLQFEDLDHTIKACATALPTSSRICAR